MSKIVKNYIVDEDQKKTNSPVFKAPPIIKIPIVEKQNVSIKTESSSSNKLNEPILKLNRNNEGVVLSIEVQCTCGEKMIIKMEY